MFCENAFDPCWRMSNVRVRFVLQMFFYDFGERHSSLILYWFCVCFVKMYLTVVGGCLICVLCLFYIAFFMLSVSWKGQTETYSVFYNGFIYVSRPLMTEFVEGCECSSFVILLFVC